MSALFSRYTLRNLTLANRIVVSPMCQYSSVNGEANAWHVAHLGSLSFSGAGLLFVEATAVEPEGRITPSDLGLYDNATEAALKPVLAMIRQYSKVAVGMQLAHAGRKASCAVPWEGANNIPFADGGWQTSAPSALPWAATDTTPAALDDAGLQRIRDAFRESTERAERLGFDLIEVHGGHGYLLHQFLSPLSNHRTDSYGGSLENRMRFPLEIFEIVRAAFPAHKPAGIRVSATDWVEGGWDSESTVAFAAAVRALGADFIDVSSGGLSPLQKIQLGPAYQLPYAEAVKAKVDIPVIAVGLITEAKQAEEIIASGKADLVALARAMLYDPRWPWHAAAELGATVQAPRQYWRSLPRGVKGLFGPET
jgi:2,4-dienoyl-CoA reductase-like NADH-dependent reductase (Old Yellow Enzyme family)